ncbi:MAG: ABC transporter permease [Aquabacterium sp.]
MRFALIVALRFLREGRFQSFLILFGVAAGVAVVTYISALIQGLQGNTINRTLGAQAHLTVKPPEDRAQAALAPAAGTQMLRDVQARAQRPRSIDNWQPLLRELAATPGVSAATAVVSGSGLALRGEGSRSVAVTGVDLEGYDRIVAVSEKVVRGQARLGPGDTMVGQQLADDLGVGVGDRIIVRTGVEGVETFTITALFDLGNRELNRRNVFITLRAAQSLFGLPGGATHLYATVDDLFGAEAMARQLTRRLGQDVESWMDSNAALLSALNAQTISTRLIRIFTGLVVMLGIASVLVVWVVQKRKEIGILRAMGATRTQMTAVFLFQGALVGLVGSLLGTALAAALLWAFSTFVTGSDGQRLFVVSMEPSLALLVAGVATLCGVLAAAAPARSAARLDPAQAIRL